MSHDVIDVVGVVNEEKEDAYQETMITFVCL